MKISVVTTFHAAGYARYGKRMVATFLRNWPEEVTLHVYAEDCGVDERAVNLVVRDLHQESKQLVAFKRKWAGVPKANGDVTSDPVRSRGKDAGRGFKWDAVRFAHKVYAIFHCAKVCDSDVLFWMDADTVCHSPITLSEIEQFCSQSDTDLGFLGREGKFSECGLYSMNLRSPAIQQFLAMFQHLYDDAEAGIFTLHEWHDSFVFDEVRKRVPGIRQTDWSEGLISGEGHPLINSRWGAYLDHLKGRRKDEGRSRASDLIVQRTEDYWKSDERLWYLRWRGN